MALPAGSQSALARVHADKRLHLVPTELELFGVRGRSAEQRVALDVLADESVGIVSLGDVRSAEPSPATSLSVWELNYLLTTLTVGKIMTPHPFAISPDATLAEAARMMLEHRISGLPVVDEERHVIGIITESDIFAMVVLHEWGSAEEA